MIKYALFLLLSCSAAFAETKSNSFPQTLAFCETPTSSPTTLLFRDAKNIRSSLKDDVFNLKVQKQTSNIQNKTVRYTTTNDVDKTIWDLSVNEVGNDKQLWITIFGEEAYFGSINTCKSKQEFPQIRNLKVCIYKGITGAVINSIDSKTLSLSVQNKVNKLKVESYRTRFNDAEGVKIEYYVGKIADENPGYSWTIKVATKGNDKQVSAIGPDEFPILWGSLSGCSNEGLLPEEE